MLLGSPSVPDLVNLDDGVETRADHFRIREDPDYIYKRPNWEIAAPENAGFLRRRREREKRGWLRAPG